MLQRFASGLLASGLMALLLKLVGMQPTTLEIAQPLTWQNMPLFALLSGPDPSTEAIVRQYLQSWSTKGAVAANQGIWIQSGLTRLADNQGTVPLPAASLTKIATTLAALNKWGPNYQFETLVSATGPIENGVLKGDLVITGSGDPFLVWEEAIALGNSLQMLGIRRIAGSLVLVGNFYMNYQQNPAMAGQMFQQALNSSTWSRDAMYSYNLMPPKTPKPQIAIAQGVKVATIPIPKQLLLVRHKSVPLVHILKEMNIYSNNAIAQMLADSLGGAAVTAQMAAKSANIPPAEIQMVNGSGLGVENRISPRAICAMLIEVERFLQPYQLSVRDIFPVSGLDKRGTLHARHIPAGTAIKTGTLRDVSSLAGVMPTRDHGSVWFAILNRGNDVTNFRKQQDLMLTSLSQQWGTLPPVNATTAQVPKPLGDPKRNETISGVQAKL